MAKNVYFNERVRSRLASVNIDKLADENGIKNLDPLALGFIVEKINKFGESEQEDIEMAVIQYLENLFKAARQSSNSDTVSLNDVIAASDALGKMGVDLDNIYHQCAIAREKEND